MDEKRLGEIEDALNKKKLSLSGLVTAAEEADIIRLARLGLWAEQHGIPAIKLDIMHAGGVTGPVYHREIRRALAALPKEL